jgi:hypothetical protein
MSTKMAPALVAAGEVDDLATGEAVARHQKACLICGWGILVTPWGAVTPKAERVSLAGLGADGLPRELVFHAGCLGESASVGSAIAVALGHAEPEV